MKRVLVLALALVLTLTTGIAAMAAIEAPGETCIDWEWGIGWDDPFYEFGFLNIDSPVAGEDGIWHLWGTYYQNDFTFAQVLFGENNDNSINALRGSYLFENNFFVGAEFVNDDSNGDYFRIAPGYRFSLGERSYAAVSVNFTDPDNGDSYTYLEGNVRYWFDNARIQGHLYIPFDSDYSFELLIHPSFKIQDNLIVGAILEYIEDETEEISVIGGCTWMPEKFVIDTILSFNYEHVDQTYFMVGGLYQLTDQFAFGANIDKLEDRDTQFAIKAKYALNDKANLKFKYDFETDDAGDAILLTYFSNF